MLSALAQHITIMTCGAFEVFLTYLIVFILLHPSCMWRVQVSKLAYLYCDLAQHLNEILSKSGKQQQQKNAL